MKKVRAVLKKIRLFLIGLIIVAFFGISATLNDFEIGKNLDIFATLYRQLNLYYVDEIEPGSIMKSAIDGMLATLDPYTNYIPESDIEDYQIMTTGQYGGIGATIHRQDDYIIITEPYENSPATRAGLMAGDKIIEINGKPAKGKSVDEVSSILKGQPGTSATLVIERPGETQRLIKMITREEIKIPDIPYSGRLNNNIAYVKLNSFTMNASRDVAKSLNTIKEQGPLNGVIIDLRGNGGGLLNEAVNIVNLFVDRGVEVVTTRGRLKDRQQTYKTLNLPWDKDIPLAILVDKYSASSSEILAGAIQDLDRGLVIGQRTFGKGLVQNVVPLSYNAKLKVTVAKYYIPSGRCIQAIDYSKHDTLGEPLHLPDSLAKAFKTKNGRTVYDGGGIKPDVVIEPENLSIITATLLSNYLIFDYATQFRLQHSTIAPAKDFVFTDEMYQDFIRFLSGKKYDYTTETEDMLEELKKTAENEKYLDQAMNEFNALKNKLLHNKTEDLIKFSKQIKRLLQQEIVIRYYFEKGRIENTLSFDEELQKAITILSDKTLYFSYLKPQNTQSINKK